MDTSRLLALDLDLTGRAGRRRRRPGRHGALRRPGSADGDRARAAAAIISVAESGTAPLHQLLGSDSSALATARVESLAREIDAGRALALATDLPGTDRRCPSGDDA